jgi:hypothetical protein
MNGSSQRPFNERTTVSTPVRSSKDERTYERSLGRVFKTAFDRTGDRALSDHHAKGSKTPTFAVPGELSRSAPQAEGGTGERPRRTAPKGETNVLTVGRMPQA